MKRILIVGEFPSQKEANETGLFNDGNWRRYKAMLSRAGINPETDCDFAYVFPQSASGGLFYFLGPKIEGRPGVRPLLRIGAKQFFVKEQFMHHVEALWEFIANSNYNLVLAAGDAALWATTVEQSVEKNRGRVTIGHPMFPEQKVLPTYAPRSLAMDVSVLPVLLMDFDKARRESLTKEAKRPKRLVYIPETVEDLYQFRYEFLDQSPEISLDIETKDTMITCVGLAPTADRVLVVPFFTEGHVDGNYWRTHREEVLAWKFIKTICQSDKWEIFGQNLAYDFQHLWRSMGICIRGWSDDTMLIHHALQPEMKKGLGFQASLYTDEREWKSMSKRKSADRTGKKEDE